MYLIFRCDCGRAVYSKKGIATRKCVCGKTIKVKERRIIATVEEAIQASDMVRTKKRNMVVHISQQQIKYLINVENNLM